MNPSTPSTGPENELENSDTYPVHLLADSIIKAENRLQKLEECKPLSVNFVTWFSTACSLLHSRLKITQVSGQSQCGLKELKGRLQKIYEDPTFSKIREAQESLSFRVEQDYQFIIGFFKGEDNN